MSARSAAAATPSTSSPSAARSEGEDGGGEHGLHHRLLGRHRQGDRVAAERGDRQTLVDRHRRGRHVVPETLEHLQHLGGGAGPGDRHDMVVAPVEAVLRGREGVGLAVAGGLAQRRPRPRHVQRGAAPDDGDARPAGRKRSLVQREGGRGGTPRLGLTGELELDVGGHVRRLRSSSFFERRCSLCSRILHVLTTTSDGSCYVCVDAAVGPVDGAPRDDRRERPGRDRRRRPAARCFAGHRAPRPRRARRAAAARADPRRRRGPQRVVRPAVAVQAVPAPRREAGDRRRGGRAGRSRWRGRPQRRHHHHRGGASAGVTVGRRHHRARSPWSPTPSTSPTSWPCGRT